MAWRGEVEGYLSRHPEAASRVMADLLVRDELRLAMPATPFTAGTLEAARRLQRGLFWGQVTHRLRRIAAVAVFVGVGWFAHAALGVLGVQATEAVRDSVVEGKRGSVRLDFGGVRVNNTNKIEMKI